MDVKAEDSSKNFLLESMDIGPCQGIYSAVNFWNTKLFDSFSFIYIFHVF